MMKKQTVESNLVGYCFNSGALYHIAAESYNNWADAKDSLIGVIFALASIEAFMNELVACYYRGKPAQVAVLADVLRIHDEQSILKKWQLIHLILSGQPIDLGRRPSQDLRALITVRNSLVHARPQSINNDGIPQYLIERGIVEPYSPTDIQIGLNRLSTRSVAKWAYETAIACSASIAQLAPNDMPHLIKAFQPVDKEGV